MPRGSIVTRVYTSDAYLPLREVPVVYTKNEENGAQKLLSIQITDSSGLTAPFYIETPDLSKSLSPNETTRPYELINIFVSYPGYNAATAEGVQIFPDTQTIQGFQLSPVPPAEHTSSETYRESSQDL